MLPKDIVEFEALMKAFESGNLPKDKWHHAEHVAVAFWYLKKMDRENAIKKICNGIQNLNKHHKVIQTETSGYHETWTIFFALILDHYIKTLNADTSFMEQMNSAIDYLRDFREVTKKYYTKDRIMSWEARTSWVSPDLKEIGN